MTDIKICNNRLVKDLYRAESGEGGIWHDGLRCVVAAARRCDPLREARLSGRSASLTVKPLLLLIQHRLQVSKGVVGSLTDIFLCILACHYAGAILVSLGVL